jgi:hypothetical protein
MYRRITMISRRPLRFRHDSGVRILLTVHPSSYCQVSMTTVGMGKGVGQDDSGSCYDFRFPLRISLCVSRFPIRFLRSCRAGHFRVEALLISESNGRCVLEVAIVACEADALYGL